MGRKRIDNSDELLIHHVQARLSTIAFSRLNRLLDNSQCASMGELVRKILTKEKIICYYKDTTLDTPIEELIKITKELNAIGVNINQITKHFHQADHPSQKMFDSLKVAEQYREVGVKVDRLLTVVSELSKKWLQELKVSMQSDMKRIKEDLKSLELENEGSIQSATFVGLFF